MNEQRIFENRVNKIVDLRLKTLGIAIHQPEQLIFLLLKSGWKLHDIEKQTIICTLKNEENNLSKTAIRLGISWQALNRKIEKFNIIINRKIK